MRRAAAVALRAGATVQRPEADVDAVAVPVDAVVFALRLWRGALQQRALRFLALCAARRTLHRCRSRPPKAEQPQQQHAVAATADPTPTPTPQRHLARTQYDGADRLLLSWWHGAGPGESEMAALHGFVVDGAADRARSGATVAVARMRRLARRTARMSAPEYEHFCRARQQASFSDRRPADFRAWLSAERSCGALIGDEVLSLLGFLAVELVAELVEAAQSVRRQQARDGAEHGALREAHVREAVRRVAPRRAPAAWPARTAPITCWAW